MNCSKENFYEYGESIGIKSEDLKKLLDLAKNEIEDSKSIIPEKILQKDDLRIDRHGLTVGSLKKSIEESGLPDDAFVLTERVEDVYYERHGWSVYLKEGHHFHSVLSMNEKMRKEIERREKGFEPEYPGIEDPNEHICEDENFLNEMKDQYTPAWCSFSDEGFLFINLHY